MHSRRTTITAAEWGRLPVERQALLIESIPGARGFLPWVGIYGTLLGTLFAFVTIPEDCTLAGSLRIPGLGLALGMMVGPVLAALMNPRNIVRTENIIGLAPLYWLLLDLVQGSYDMPGIAPKDVGMTFIMLGLMNTCFWLGTLGKPWTLPQSFIRSCTLRPSEWSLFCIIVVCFILAMLDFAIPCQFDLVVMFKALGQSRWLAPWARGAEGGWDAFRDHLTYFGYLLPAFSTMLARRRGWLNPLSVLGILMAVIFLAFVAQGGARRIVGAMLGAALCYWVLDRPKVKFSQLAVAGATIVVILWMMQVMVYMRNAGFSERGNEAMYVATKNVQMQKTGLARSDFIHVDDNFYRMVNIVDVVPRLHDYVHLEYLYYVLIRPIPRVFWPGKPTNSGFTNTLQSAEGTSLTCSIVGELYITWGPLAVALGGWLMGRAARLNYMLFYSSSGSLAPLFYSYMTMWLFDGYRGMIDVVLFTYPLLGWMALSWIFRRQVSNV